MCSETVFDFIMGFSCEEVSLGVLYLLQFDLLLKNIIQLIYSDDTCRDERGNTQPRDVVA